MNTITVIVTDLVAKLEENRAQHAKDYEDAKAGYLETAAEKLEELLDKIARGEVVSLHVGLSVPECHLEEYDRALQMLKWHQEPKIELDVEEFTNYVQDNWNWKDRWTLSNTAYLSKVRG